MARLPYTNRLATRCTRSRTGWNPTATIAVARIDRPRLGLPPLPTSAPIPTAIPTYTPVINTASEPYTRVRLITTSMSYSRYLRIATPHASGMATAKPAIRTALAIGVLYGPSESGTEAAYVTSVMPTAYANHLICCRSSPAERRYRTTTLAPPTSRRITPSGQITQRLPRNVDEMPLMAIGLLTGRRLGATRIG